MGSEATYQGLFQRAALRAQAGAARAQARTEEARGVLAEGDWPTRLPGLAPAMQAVVLHEALARAWRGRFGDTQRHLAEFLSLRRLAAAAYARSRDPEVREVWFDAAARTANAYRILGLYPECRRNLARLATIEQFVGTTSATAATVRAIQERGARRLSFLATLEWTQGNYATALARANWEIAKRRILVDPEPLAIAYSVRCAIRLDTALDLTGAERAATVEAARRDALRCVEHSADPAVSAAPLASLALWIARDGGAIEPFSRRLEAWTSDGLTIPEAIALRLPWARALLAASDSVAKADALLVHCYQRFCALGRVTDAGLVALDRIRIRLESGIPLGIVQLVLEAKTRLNQASLTPETVRVLDALWLRVLQAARPSGARPNLGAELHAAHVALARE